MPVTVAVNCTCCPTGTLAVAADTTTLTEVATVPPPPQETTNWRMNRPRTRKNPRRIRSLDGVGLFTLAQTSWPREGFTATFRMWDCPKGQKGCLAALGISLPPMAAPARSIEVAPVWPRADFHDQRHGEFVDSFHLFLNHLFQLLPLPRGSFEEQLVVDLQESSSLRASLPPGGGQWRSSRA